MKYHYITVQFVMHYCESVEDAVIVLKSMLPYMPDATTAYMESWEIQKVVEAKNEHNMSGL